MRDAETILADTDHRACMRRLIAVISDPLYYSLPVSQIVKAAKISNATYFRLINEPELILARRECCRQLLGDIREHYEVLRASALIPGPDGAADRRLLFALAGVLPDKYSRVDVNVNLENKGGSDSEILWCYLNLAWPKEKWRPQIRDGYKRGLIQPREPERFGQRGPLPMIEVSETTETSKNQIDNPPSGGTTE